MPRNTRTGAVLEQMVLPALEMGGYVVERQVRLTERLGGGRHYGDIVASKDGERIVISESNNLKTRTKSSVRVRVLLMFSQRIQPFTKHTSSLVVMDGQSINSF